MGRLEQQMLAAAKEGASGSASSFGAHLMSKLTSGGGDPKLITEGVKQELGLSSPEPTQGTLIETQTTEAPTAQKTDTFIKPEHGGDLRQASAILGRELAELNKEKEPKPKKSERNHDGNGKQADRPALAKSVGDATKTEKQRAPEDFAVLLKAEKERAEMEIADIKNRLNEAEKLGQADVVRNWKIRLGKAEDILKQVETATLPAGNPSSAESYARLQNYKIARDRQTQGELKKLSEERANATLSPAENVVDLTNTNNPANAMENFPTPEQGTTDDWKERADKALEHATGELPGKSLSMIEQYAEGATHIPVEESVASDKIINITEGDTEQPQAQEPTGKTPGELREEKLRAEIPGLIQNYNEEKQIEDLRMQIQSATGFREAQEFPEELIRKNAENAEKELAERIEKTPSSLGMVQRVAEKWNSIPWYYKLALSTGLVATGVVAGAVTPLLLTGAALRGMGGIGMLYSLKAGLEKEATKKSGAPLTEAEELRATVFASALSFVVAAALPTAFHNVIATPLAEQLGKMHGSHNETSLPQPTATIAPAHFSLEYVGIAETGDSRWSIAERALSEGPYKDQFKLMTEEQRTYAIDAIKDKLTAGMTAEQANTLNVGDKIDFKEIFADKSFMDETFSGAQELSPEDITNIHNYTGEMSGTTGIAVSNEDMAKTSGTPVITPETPETPAPEQSPARFAPNDPAVLERVNKEIHTDIDKLFGGFGVKDGMDSIDWKDREVGFANKAVSEVMNARPVAFPEDGARHFGVEDYNATEKMQEYLNTVMNGTQIPPEAGETVKEYLERALAIATTEDMNEVLREQEFFAEHPVEDVLISGSTENTPLPEAVPTDPVVIEQTNNYIHGYINDLFGSKGFLGIGAKDGMDSIDWKDPKVGFKNIPAVDVMGTKPNAFPNDGVRRFGIMDYGATERMANFLKAVINETGVKPTVHETTENYLQRAGAIAISNAMNEGNLNTSAVDTATKITPEISTTKIVTESMAVESGVTNRTEVGDTMSGTTGKEFLSGDFGTKLKPSGAGLDFDRQMAMTTSRSISAQVAAYNELLTSGKTNEAAQHLSEIYKIADNAEKTLGKGVVDRSKLPVLK